MPVTQGAVARQSWRALSTKTLPRPSITVGLLPRRCLLALWPEDKAGGGAVGVDSSASVDNLSLSRRGAAADVNDLRFATDLARLR